MTVGERIKERLTELGQDVKWLHDRTHVPVSSLYEIMNGRMKSTPRLPTIAAALGLRALWLERKAGQRLVSDADDVTVESEWPFPSINRKRWDTLSPAQRAHIEEEVERMLRTCEVSAPRPRKKSAATRAAGQRRAAG